MTSTPSAHSKHSTMSDYYLRMLISSRSIENKEKRFYIRAKQDPKTMYFHAAEAPPCYARISDESHPLCAADNIQNGFTKDMLTKTGEAGQQTTRTNVFAREGQFFWEAKIISTSKEHRFRVHRSRKRHHASEAVSVSALRAESKRCLFLLGSRLIATVPIEVQATSLAA